MAQCPFHLVSLRPRQRRICSDDLSQGIVVARFVSADKVRQVADADAEGLVVVVLVKGDQAHAAGHARLFGSWDQRVDFLRRGGWEASQEVTRRYILEGEAY